MAINFDIIKTPTGFLKTCEIVITIIILSVGQGVVKSIYGSAERIFVVGGACVLSIVTSTLLLISYIIGDTQIQKTRFEFLVNVCLALLMITAGSLIINSYTVYDVYISDVTDAALAVGSFGIINSIFYALDAYFAYQNFSE
ncbi:uncharacterized protein LOC135207303 [Macrobrachium nipponense]|uniref:uncharacterized protein LOC135207303 n=1 Tax=Macrobrachium nipponense TaxID=159736 RepID=UPI0030C888EF